MFHRGSSLQFSPVDRVSIGTIVLNYSIGTRIFRTSIGTHVLNYSIGTHSVLVDVDVNSTVEATLVLVLLLLLGLVFIFVVVVVIVSSATSIGTSVLQTSIGTNIDYTPIGEVLIISIDSIYNTESIVTATRERDTETSKPPTGFDARSATYRSTRKR